jgi:hypothetical protein
MSFTRHLFFGWHGQGLAVRHDPWLESTDALAPLSDPSEHNCGTVRPHGHRELAHPEQGYYAVGAKRYKRAPFPERAGGGLGRTARRYVAGLVWRTTGHDHGVAGLRRRARMVEQAKVRLRTVLPHPRELM